MANLTAGPWVFYNRFALDLGAGDINLDTAALKLALFHRTGNVRNTGIDSFAQLTSEITAQNGYVAGGLDMTGTWSQATDANADFVIDPVVLDATVDGPIVNWYYAVLYSSTTGLNIMYCPLYTLSETPTLLADGSLTLSFPNNVLYRLTQDG